jgi:hypothetical protein
MSMNNTKYSGHTLTKRFNAGQAKLKKNWHVLAEKLDTMTLDWKQVTKYPHACWQFAGVLKPQMA